MDNVKEYKIKCLGCATISTVDHLKVNWVVLEDGTELKVTYYRCCGCRKIHIVQLDDKYTQNLFDELTEGIKYACLCKEKGRTPKKKMARKYLKINKRISKERKSLNVKYDGVEVTIGDEKVKIHVEMQEV